jgi:hypothetical protein
MPQSESIAELAAALAKAQGLMPPAIKDAQNPHLKNRYADLASVWEACRGPLSAHGIAVTQLPVPDGEELYLMTTLMHSSGQWVSSLIPLRFKKEGEPGRSAMQAMGSAMTYARRFALMAIAGVACEDDDGQAAGPPHPQAERPRNGHAPPPVEAEEPRTYAQWCQSAARRIGISEYQLNTHLVKWARARAEQFSDETRQLLESLDEGTPTQGDKFKAMAAVFQADRDAVRLEAKAYKAIVEGRKQAAPAGREPGEEG